MKKLLQWGRARASAEIAGGAPGQVRMFGLQWGRARASAEMLSASKRSTKHAKKLQWGRARASAEMTRDGTAASGSRSLLQWGRARASAEIAMHPKGRVVITSSFNGAALVRARKSQRSAARIGGNLNASMGPRSCERGNEEIDGKRYARCEASMGPRSCERGNHQATQIIGNDCFMLQWGRARASAEMAAPPHCVTSSKTASMGPRSCERGNMTGYPHGRPGYVIASMGPRSCERGNTRTLRYSCSAACWLQWGRARASAEIIAQRLIGLGVAELQWGRARASAEMTDPNKWGFYSYSFNGAALV